MTPELLAGLAGVLLSLLFAYIPGAEGWFAALDGVKKRLVMLGLLISAVVLVAIASCTGLYDVGIACTQAGIADLIRLFLTAFVANQATYLMAGNKKPELEG